MPIIIAYIIKKELGVFLRVPGNDQQKTDLVNTLYIVPILRLSDDKRTHMDLFTVYVITVMRTTRLEYGNKKDSTMGETFLKLVWVSGYRCGRMGDCRSIFTET